MNHGDDDDIEKHEKLPENIKKTCQLDYLDKVSVPLPKQYFREY